MTGSFRPAEITQDLLPHTPWDDPALSRMPGMRPVAGPWIVVDEAYAAQMAERERLMVARPDAIFAETPGAGPAMEELRRIVLASLPDGFARAGGTVTCPDGRQVSEEGPPFAVLNALLQEDLLLLDRRGDEHVLIAGLLCFPAHWTLAQKIGRPLGRIHRPIPVYDDALALRVQRLFDRAPPGRAMWRANVLPHDDAVLHRPRLEGDPRPHSRPPRYIRSERQTILRLPETGAVLFAVHTWIVPVERLTEDQRARCPVL
ncbi:DUF3445 domain-containing protein [uncultured Jannaschia sp.]|uniref:heme-dependent oxidative N-demethylase family protein n=1 Tax=uncultured Jannaschia sp. TaxID=293347 RepID=UPI0026375AA0|nr:DUF3445 domain-containing protein [uncultured Jannaschia sp.]